MRLKEWIRQANEQARQVNTKKSLKEIESDDVLLRLVPRYEIRHRLPGRIRLFFPILRNSGDLKKCMRMQLATEKGVTRVTASPLCESLTVFYNPEEVSEKSLFDAINRISVGKLLSWKDKLPPPLPADEMFNTLNPWVLAGSSFLVLGVVGIAMPVIPGTPFLLLSAACYMRGSKSLYHWLVNHEILGRYVSAYYEGKGIPMKAKLCTVGFLWLSTSISVAMMWGSGFTVAFMLLMSLGVTTYMLSLKTYEPNHAPEDAK